mmetsp:Transcript_65923/g.208624  ORF Transcript_65923/g.208624 Transcript_65923/m.208624 type:complete len:151 (-) Transcript_65923:133-585(-)
MSHRMYHNLDEIFAGICDGMTYEEIQAKYPEEFEMRKKNKLGYRYPRGESYLDVIARLDPLIHEIESYKEPLLIVGHQGVLRLIYAYLMDLPREAAPRISIPLNTVIKLTPMTDHTEEEAIRISKVDQRDGQKEPFSPDFDNAGDNPPSH